MAINFAYTTNNIGINNNILHRIIEIKIHREPKRLQLSWQKYLSFQNSLFQTISLLILLACAMQFVNCVQGNVDLKNMTSLKFYNDLLSQPVRAIWIFLKANKIPFEDIQISLLKGMH